MDNIDKTIINRLQDGLPVCHRPWATVAQEIGIGEQDLIDRLQGLLSEGYLTRLGPMYHAENMGGGLTLAALKVPPERFDDVAEIV
ncbi:MAG: Lrp/AsnC family transcriptional regulator, partial [Pseudomonadales bacterium]